MDILKLSDEKLKLARDMLNSGFEENKDGFIPLSSDKQKVLVSISNGKMRAVTFTGTGNSIETAFQSARGKALKYCEEKIFIPKMTLISFVSSERRVPFIEFLRDVNQTKSFYYRTGISFDEFYQFAFLEQELNGHAIINWKTPANSDKRKFTNGFHENGRNIPSINFKNISLALRSRGLKKFNSVLDTKDTDEIILFSTKAVYIDSTHSYNLASDGLQSGLRLSIFDDVDNRNFLIDLAKKNADYLLTTIHLDGSMVYGYFPWFGKTVPGYNTVRHCLSIMAFMEMYKLTNSVKYGEAARKTYKYFFDTFTVETDDGLLAINDPANDNEIRLGALGLALVAMQMYSDIFNTDEDIEKAEKIAEMICSMQNAETGEFTHVLNYPDFTFKDHFRTVYYPGEACYGLMRLYKKTKNARILETVKKAFDFFIEEHYETYSDHWLSYSVNELTESYPDDKYFEFGLKNVFEKIDFMLVRETTFSTLLELLNAAYKMVERIKSLGKDYLLEPYDLNKFYKAIGKRVKFQANGIMFPEMAMFFSEPTKILYGVFIRHHTFRIRNDDVAHHLIGYCHYLENVLK